MLIINVKNVRKVFIMMELVVDKLIVFFWKSNYFCFFLMENCFMNRLKKDIISVNIIV